VKTTLLAVSCLLFAPALARATSISLGTPGNSQLATPTGPSPNLHGYTANFDNLSPFTSALSFNVGAFTISSPDGLETFPFSAQSFPEELFDTSSDGTADVKIRLGVGTNAIGVGIADIDPVTLSFQALGATGTPVGALFSENLATLPVSAVPGNFYFLITDSTPDIFGVEITQTVGDPVNFSGLAIDDVQAADIPEPGTMALLATGLTLFGFRRRA